MTSSSPTWRIAIRAFIDLPSDHLPVVFERDQAVNLRQQGQRHNYYRANWPQLTRYIEDRIPDDPPLATTDEIDSVLHCLTQDIGETEQRFIPSTPVTRKFTNIDTATKRIISLRNAIRHQFQRTENQGRKVLYRKLSKIIAIRVQNQ